MRRREVLVALGVAALVGCAAVTPAPPREPALHWLALGDSYTIGEGVAASERWPAQLADRLRADGVDLAEPDIVAVTGWTTDELLDGIEARSDLREEYDLVTLSIGVNNQYRGRSTSEFAQGFIGTLSRAIDFAGGDARRVVVVSIPDWGVSPFAARSDADSESVARDIDAFNDVKARIAENAKSAFVDVTAVSRERAAAEDFAEDGLHPSAVHYGDWTTRIAPAAKAVLERRVAP